MSTAISVHNLGKKYTIGHQKQGDLRHALGDKIRGLFRPDSMQQEDFWAIRNLDFEIQHGEAVGIIGRNGAGKSTLLKILSRITEPTTGRFEINGRVSSLLEVGTGFHSELSGRENIFLNGTILGMRKAEIKQKFDEIVAFSGVEKFIDTPVKHYSSGMKVRLAFSVAAHLEPEILIVDEVLAVGDAEFQKKCLGKMDEVSKNEGRTVLFVSHNMGAVQNLCSTGIVLKDGQPIFKGEIQKAVSSYLNLFTQDNRQVNYDLYSAPGNESCKLVSASARGLGKTIDMPIEVQDAIQLDFSFLCTLSQITNVSITFHLVDEMGTLVFVSGSAREVGEVSIKEGRLDASGIIPKNIMHEGMYTIHRLLVVKDRGSLLMETRDSIQFEVMAKQDGKLGWRGKKEGVIRPKLDWKVILS